MTNIKREAHQYRMLQAKRLIESMTVNVAGQVYTAYVKTSGRDYLPNPEVAAAEKACRPRQVRRGRGPVSSRGLK